MIVTAASRQQQVVSKARMVRPLRPGQSLSAAYVNAVSRQAGDQAQSSLQNVFPAETAMRPQIHWIQGNADFPAVGEQFGPDVFLGRGYEIFAFYATFTGSGSWVVQLMVDGELVGDQIGTGSLDEYTEMSEHVVYGDNKTIGLYVVSQSGTIENFVCVFDCWRLL